MGGKAAQQGAAVLHSCIVLRLHRAAGSIPSMQPKQQSIRAFLKGPAARPAASGIRSSCTIEGLSEDNLLLVLGKLTQSERCGHGSLVCAVSPRAASQGTSRAGGLQSCCPIGYAAGGVVPTVAAPTASRLPLAATSDSNCHSCRSAFLPSARCSPSHPPSPSCCCSCELRAVSAAANASPEREGSLPAG